MTEIKKKVVLTKEGLENDLKNEGLTRLEMAQKYGIPASQIKKALKMVGLEGVKATRVLFEIGVSPVASTVEPKEALDVCPSPEAGEAEHMAEAAESDVIETL
jgi:hypothetical protein